jgi:glutathione S-transferase
MIRLHHAPMTRSVRVRWLLLELGLEHELVTLDFLGGDLRKPAFLAKSPLGKVPVLEDGDVCMFESGAIVEYLLEKYGKGRLAPPPGTPARAEFLQWVHWSEATAMPSLSTYFQNTLVKPEAERVPQVVPEALAKLTEWLGMLDRHLSSRKYMLGGEFSAADIMMGYTIGGARFAGQVDGRFPNVAAYAARLEERPAYRTAFAM